MKGSTKPVQQPGGIPIQTAAADSPTYAAIPFWITACVRLQPPLRSNGAEVTGSLANAVFPAVQALIADRLRTSGDAATPLNRDRIARRCGFPDAKKTGWLFDYLGLIGFLRINSHHRGVGRGRGADTFDVYEQPPIHYIGPRTHAELERALDDPERPLAKTLFIGKSAGQAEDAGSGTYSAEQGARSGTLVGKSAGHAEDAGSGTYSAEQGARSGTLIGDPSGQTEHSGSGLFSIDRSSISEREIEGSIEPVAGGAAKPPATGMDEEQLAAVDDLITALPWQAWANYRGKTFELRQSELETLRLLISEAMASTGITLEQAGTIAQVAIGEAETNPFVYLAGRRGAFQSPQLQQRVLALRTVRLSENPLPLLLGAAQPQVSATTRRGGAKSATRRAASSDASAPDVTGPDAWSRKCDGCEAEPGAKRYERLVTDADGRMKPCELCCP